MKTLGSCCRHPCFLFIIIVSSKVTRSRAWDLEPREWGGIRFSMNKVSDFGQITEHLCSSFLSCKQGYSGTHLLVIRTIWIIIYKVLE